MFEEDRLCGKALLIVYSLAFTYFTVWILLTPFVDEGHAVLSLFPPRYYALVLPSILGSLLFGGVMTFIGVVFITAQLQRRNDPDQVRARMKKAS